MELKKTLINWKDNFIAKYKWAQKIVDVYRLISANRWVRFVAFLYLVCFTMFAFTLVQNQFTIPVSGDFTLQEIPFYYNGYDDWWTALTTGQFVLWDDSGMLGSNNIGANTFYYLFNPFFLVILLVPRSLIPQAQAFMMITKMVLSGVAMKLLLEKFKLKEETTYLISIAYAFCGYNLYYLWFNHFLEMAVLMPLVLLGIEKILREQKPLTLVFSLFITGLTNYFFLIAFCFCGVIYALFRYFQMFKQYSQEEKEKKSDSNKHLDIRLNVILQGIFAFAAGLMLTCVVLFPCFSVALDNPRMESAPYVTGLTNSLETLWLSIKGEGSFWESLKNFFHDLTSWDYAGNTAEKYILYPLIAFFTPNATCYDSVIFKNNGYDNAYASLFIYTPLLLMFIPSVIQSFKKRAISTSVALLGLGFLLFTPFAYYCFSGFTGTAYARWYIFVTAIACVFIGVQYDKREEMKTWTIDISFALIAFVYGFLLYKGEFLYNEYGSSINLKEIDERTLYMYGELIYLFIMYLYLRKHYKRHNLTQDLRYFVAFEAIVMCNITLIGQGTVAYNQLFLGQENIQTEMAIAEQLTDEDDDYYRVFSTTADRNGNNLGMMLNTPGLGSFHSVYNFELEDFIEWSQIRYGSGRGGWSMGFHEKRVNLDQFVGVKYYILKNGDTNVPFGFNEYMTTDTHTVYHNDNYIQLGYAFDNIIQTQAYENRAEEGAMTYRTGNGMDSSTYKELLFNEKGYLEGAILYYEDIVEIFGENYLTETTDFKFITSKDILAEDIYYTTNSSYDGYQLRDSQISVYYAEWHDQPTFDDKEENYTLRGGYSTTNARELTWFSYMDIDTKHLNIGAECDTRGKCYVTVQARMGENLEITLYGEDENGNEYILTQDKHMTHWFDKSGDAKRHRGFYVDDEVTKIRIRVLETMDNNRYLLKPHLTWEYEDTYLNQINELKTSPLENITRDVNSFEFDTSFSSRKMIVLQIPYDKGWSLKVEDENGNKIESPKIYKAQGGFISFMGEEGEYHYKISYQTPYLSQGIAVMALGMLCVGAYIVGVTHFELHPSRFKRRYDLKQN